MTKILLTIITAAAMLGCAKPGCNYGELLQSAADRAGMSRTEAKVHEAEVRTRCGLGERRAIRGNRVPGTVCTTVNERLICRAR